MSKSDNNINVCFISTIPEQAREYLIERLKPLDNVQVIFRKDKTVEDILKLAEEHGFHQERK